MKLLKPIAVGLLVIVAVASCSKVKEAALERGIDLFMAGELEEALKVLDASAKISAENPDAHAWYAECLRRLKKFDDAADAAYMALDLDPEHAFAHTVLADVFNPQYSTWQRVDAESTWFHLQEAVRYDPGDGNAWSSLWVQAVERQDEEMAHTAAVNMIDSGFLSAPVLAYNRWQLEHLPPNAIFLTNGDMDTYPSVALQEKEGLRQDVVVANLSLLNVAPYVARTAKKYGVPLPVGPDQLESMAPRRGDKGTIEPVGRQIVRGWIEMQQRGELSRPLCAAITVADLDFAPGVGERTVYCGSYYEIMPTLVEAETDVARLEQSLAAIDAASFEGAFATIVDRSPVRRSGTHRIATNVTAAMLRYVEHLAGEERWDEASSALAGARDYDSRILAAGSYTDHMDSLSVEIAKHLEP
ncbi:MAG: tetratricopeptide repeat protein [Candidatus Eisenbacteria bacterium]